MHICPMSIEGERGEVGDCRVKLRRGNGYYKICLIFSHILKIVKIEILSLSCLSVCLSIRLFVCLRRKIGFQLNSVLWNLIFHDFSKICRGNSSFIKI